MGEAVPTPRPAAPTPQQVIEGALFDAYRSVADWAETILAALREAGYTVARLEQVGWAYCATYRGDGRWYAYTDLSGEGPQAFDDEPVWRVVGPVEHSPPEENDASL